MATRVLVTTNAPSVRDREVAEHLRLYRIGQDDQITNTLSACAIGESWVQRFLHCHLELKITMSITIDTPRIKETSKETVNKMVR